MIILLCWSLASANEIGHFIIKPNFCSNSLTSAASTDVAVYLLGHSLHARKYNSFFRWGCFPLKKRCDAVYTMGRNLYKLTKIFDDAIVMLIF